MLKECTGRLIVANQHTLSLLTSTRLTQCTSYTVLCTQAQHSSQDYWLEQGRQEGKLHPGPAHKAEDGKSRVSDQSFAGMVDWLEGCSSRVKGQVSEESPVDSLIILVCELKFECPRGTHQQQANT
jgi:hypothetical protein